MALSEIEKLERRYAENPQGLTFAPLAEVYRKNGEIPRALELLGPGLQIHPDYIPASIVLGRCHMDLGDVQAAETAFLHVLALDGENVIALKALADISERLLRFDDAERWLHSLLTVDRSNDDAREQLQRVEISRRQAEVASSAEPASVLEAPAVSEAASIPVIPDISPPTPRFEPPLAEPAVGWVSQSGQAGAAPPLGMEDLEPSALRDQIEQPAGFQLDEPAHHEDPIEPLDGLVGREVEALDEVEDEFRVETSEAIFLQSAGGSEFQMPDASQELHAAKAQGERAPFEEDAPVASWADEEAPPTEGTELDAAESGGGYEVPDEPQRTEGYSEPEPYVPEPYPPESYPPEPYPSEPYAPEPYAPEPYAPEPYAPEPYQPEPSVDEPPREPPVPAAYASESPSPESAPAEYATPEPPAAAPVPASAPIPGDFRYHRRDEDREAPGASAAHPKRSYGVARRAGAPWHNSSRVSCPPDRRPKRRQPPSGRSPPAAPARPPVPPPTRSRSARSSARRPPKPHPPFQQGIRGRGRSPSTIFSAPRATHPPGVLRGPQTPRTTTSTSFTPGFRT